MKGAPSPNPQGRPRGSRNRKALVRQIAEETRTYSEGSEQRRTTILKLVLLSVRNAAAKGDLLAIKLFDQLTGHPELEQPEVPKGC